MLNISKGLKKSHILARNKATQIFAFRGDRNKWTFVSTDWQSHLFTEAGKTVLKFA